MNNTASTLTVGSVCSGIEAASVAWIPLGMEFKWFSEIEAFPSTVLAEKYPSVINLGDMNLIPDMLRDGRINAPDLICGGTPCQAFSYAGWQQGLNDDRGNLTLRFVDIIEANDERRNAETKQPTIVFWENVEGVLSDKTNAFGCMISSLAGIPDVIYREKWPSAGLLRGPKRNVAWRVIDAKFFGLPQQRKRLYLLAGGKDYNPETILFEEHYNRIAQYPSSDLLFYKDGHTYEVFREYTDCLYASYGTKWNGNAAANNGSLFVVQDNRIRRFSPLECERLMGLPDNYTAIKGAKKTKRYKAVGNSWAVPVVRWIGSRLKAVSDPVCIDNDDRKLRPYMSKIDADDDCYLFEFHQSVLNYGNERRINCSCIPECCSFATLEDIISPDAPEDIYISPVGCHGILRRRKERNLSINKRLSEVLSIIAKQMSEEEIERRSRVQKRGRYSSQVKG